MVANPNEGWRILAAHTRELAVQKKRERFRDHAKSAAIGSSVRFVRWSQGVDATPARTPIAGVSNAKFVIEGKHSPV